MDTNNSTSGGVDDSNMGGHTVTLQFHLRSGVCSRTFNTATAYTADMFASQDPELCASVPNDLQEDMSETQELDFNAIGLNEAPQVMSQTPELFCDEDDGPEPTNKMEDHPTPPELQWSKYDELTPCTSDDDIVSPVITSARTGIVSIRTPIPKFTDFLDRLAAEELESEDNIYEDMPDLEDSVNKKPFTCTTSTDEDSDVEYSEHPFNSKTSTTNDSSNGNNDLSKQEALSESSEDVPILSSDEESDYELHHSIGGKIYVSRPIKELTLIDFICVYGKDFMAENQKYVTKCLTELQQCKNKFEMSSEEQEINRVHVMRFTSLNQNSEKSIE